MAVTLAESKLNAQEDYDPAVIGRIPQGIRRPRLADLR